MLTACGETLSRALFPPLRRAVLDQLRDADFEADGAPRGPLRPLYAIVEGLGFGPLQDSTTSATTTTASADAAAPSLSTSTSTSSNNNNSSTSATSATPGADPPAAPSPPSAAASASASSFLSLAGYADVTCQGNKSSKSGHHGKSKGPGPGTAPGGGGGGGGAGAGGADEEDEDVCVVYSWKFRTLHQMMLSEPRIGQGGPLPLPLALPPLRRLSPSRVPLVSPICLPCIHLHTIPLLAPTSPPPRPRHSPPPLSPASLPPQ